MTSNGKSVLDRFKLDGKKAIVTGGSRGIGRGIAVALAEAGADVAIVYEKAKERAEGVLAELQALGRTHSYVQQADVSVTADVQRMAEEAQRRFGQVDILINNAGIAHNAALEDMTEVEWERMIRMNLTSVFLCSQAVGRLMIKQKSGVIINVGSLSAKIVNFPQKQAHYNAAKAGVHLLTKCLAVEWAPHGIRVNVLVPGYIHTELVDPIMEQHGEMVKKHWLEPSVQNRFGTVEEMGAATVFLASDASTFTTGEEMVVDGGYTLR
jgi:NAD(P)-dependent dehydrogenase (short-subunit alcohol dehydrogenase family)